MFLLLWLHAIVVDAELAAKELIVWLHWRLERQRLIARQSSLRTFNHFLTDPNVACKH